MNISAEEKIMYSVMKAIYDSGIPISFKGSMVLKACLMEAGFSDDTRHTVDIDGNWNTDTLPSGEQMVESIQKALNQNNISLGKRYKIRKEETTVSGPEEDTSAGNRGRFSIPSRCRKHRRNTRKYR